MPLIADTMARVMQRMLAPRLARPDAALLFPDIPRRCRHISIPTPFGAAAATLFAPPAMAGCVPVHVNFHGGGYVMGHPEQDDPFCAFLAERAGVCVLNVDYVLAPQQRFPIAVEQAVAVIRWVADQAAEQRWDADRLTVGGQSAGGGLAAAASLLLAQAGAPCIAAQVLHYPPLDLVTPPAHKRARAARPAISPGVARLFNAVYVPDVATRADMRVSPLVGAPDDVLDKVAPAIVITAGLDLLQAEGAAYAQRLRARGRLLDYIDVPDQDHAYNLRGGPRDLVEAIYARIAGHLGGRLSPGVDAAPLAFHQ
ncbi:alpha/beta hydrolase fold domain-containing protein [Novosphingobium sp. SG720]|uniref:alpha/beta hydrolase fold domain-containing protein n=1 Tax=Novosphingobium sp. SG720 TaxID=2586998 RepID=UPI001444E434|nr:alpha/beta hydrolase fold domain-containing protein [Novosphingobium sp. SG720]NKJ44174.1 acetyl esterase [Novosphingobium sp. SG720]